MICDETGNNKAAGNCVSFRKRANFKLQCVATIPLYERSCLQLAVGSVLRRNRKEWIDRKWCAAIKVFECYTSFRLLVWFDHAEQAICSSFSEMFCDEIGSSEATGSSVSLPYRKWCVASLPEVVCRLRSTCISNCCVVFWFDRAELEVVVRETEKTRNERS